MEIIAGKGLSNGYSYFSWIVIVSVGLSSLGLVLLYRNQNLLLYIPNPPGLPKEPQHNPRGYRQPSDWSRSTGLLSQNSIDSIIYEDQMLTTKDGVKIHTWLMLQSEESNESIPTLIYFHGNAGNMGLRLPHAARVLAFSKMNILMMDYRGFGSSEGTPSEEGINIDADTVLEYVSTHPKLKGSPIIVFGRSLGGAVSIALAHRFPDLVNSIVLENTFLSISAMVDILMPWISWAKEYVLRISWNSDVLISSLKHPILFISGTLPVPLHLNLNWSHLVTLNYNR